MPLTDILQDMGKTARQSTQPLTTEQPMQPEAIIDKAQVAKVKPKRKTYQELPEKEQTLVDKEQSEQYQRQLDNEANPFRSLDQNVFIPTTDDQGNTKLVYDNDEYMRAKKQADSILYDQFNNNPYPQYQEDYYNAFILKKDGNLFDATRGYAGSARVALKDMYADATGQSDPQREKARKYFSDIIDNYTGTIKSIDASKYYALAKGGSIDPKSMMHAESKQFGSDIFGAAAKGLGGILSGPLETNQGIDLFSGVKSLTEAVYQQNLGWIVDSKQHDEYVKGQTKLAQNEGLVGLLGLKGNIGGSEIKNIIKSQLQMSMEKYSNQLKEDGLFDPNAPDPLLVKMQNDLKAIDEEGTNLLDFAASTGVNLTSLITDIYSPLGAFNIGGKVAKGVEKVSFKVKRSVSIAKEMQLGKTFGEMDVPKLTKDVFSNFKVSENTLNEFNHVNKMTNAVNINKIPNVNLISEHPNVQAIVDYLKPFLKSEGVTLEGSLIEPAHSIIPNLTTAITTSYLQTIFGDVTPTSDEIEAASKNLGLMMTAGTVLFNGLLRGTMIENGLVKNSKLLQNIDPDKAERLVAMINNKNMFVNGLMDVAAGTTLELPSIMQFSAQDDTHGVGKAIAQSLITQLAMMGHGIISSGKGYLRESDHLKQENEYYKYVDKLTLYDKIDNVEVPIGKRDVNLGEYVYQRAKQQNIDADNMKLSDMKKLLDKTNLTKDQLKIIDKINDLAGDVSVNFSSTDMPYNRPGKFNANDNAITVNTSVATDRTFNLDGTMANLIIHEGTHALTAGEYRNNPTFAKNIDNMFDDLITSPLLSDTPILNQLSGPNGKDEMMALLAQGDPNIIKALNQSDVSGQYEYYKRKVGKLFGGKETYDKFVETLQSIQSTTPSEGTMYGSNISTLKAIAGGPVYSINNPMPYEVKNDLNDGKGNIRLAELSKGKIYINTDFTPDYFWKYLIGEVPSETSKQKQAMLARMAKVDGYSLDKVKSILTQPQDFIDFLHLHEQSHIDNNDSGKYSDYFKKYGKLDYMSADLINAEKRATLDALKIIEKRKATQPEAVRQEVESIISMTAKDPTSFDRTEVNKTQLIETYGRELIERSKPTDIGFFRNLGFMDKYNGFEDIASKDIDKITNLYVDYYNRVEGQSDDPKIQEQRLNKSLLQAMKLKNQVRKPEYTISFGMRDKQAILDNVSLNNTPKYPDGESLDPFRTKMDNFNDRYSKQLDRFNSVNLNESEKATLDILKGYDHVTVNGYINDKDTGHDSGTIIARNPELANQLAEKGFVYLPKATGGKVIKLNFNGKDPAIIAQDLMQMDLKYFLSSDGTYGRYGAGKAIGNDPVILSLLDWNKINKGILTKDYFIDSPNIEPKDLEKLQPIFQEVNNAIDNYLRGPNGEHIYKDSKPSLIDAFTSHYLNVIDESAQTKGTRLIKDNLGNTQIADKKIPNKYNAPLVDSDTFSYKGEQGITVFEKITGLGSDISYSDARRSGIDKDSKGIFRSTAIIDPDWLKPNTGLFPNEMLYRFMKEKENDGGQNYLNRESALIDSRALGKGDEIPALSKQGNGSSGTINKSAMHYQVFDEYNDLHESELTSFKKKLQYAGISDVSNSSCFKMPNSFEYIKKPGLIDGTTLVMDGGTNLLQVLDKNGKVDKDLKDETIKIYLHQLFNEGNTPEQFKHKTYLAGENPSNYMFGSHVYEDHKLNTGAGTLGINKTPNFSRTSRFFEGELGQKTYEATKDTERLIENSSKQQDNDICFLEATHRKYADLLNSAIDKNGLADFNINPEDATRLIRGMKTMINSLRESEVKNDYINVDYAELASKMIEDRYKYALDNNEPINDSIKDIFTLYHQMVGSRAGETYNQKAGQFTVYSEARSRIAEKAYQGYTAGMSVKLGTSNEGIASYHRGLDGFANMELRRQFDNLVKQGFTNKPSEESTLLHNKIEEFGGDIESVYSEWSKLHIDKIKEGLLNTTAELLPEIFDETGWWKENAKLSGIVLSAKDIEQLNKISAEPITLGSKILVTRVPLDNEASMMPAVVIGLENHNGGVVRGNKELIAHFTGADDDGDGISLRPADKFNFPKKNFDPIWEHWKEQMSYMNNVKKGASDLEAQEKILQNGTRKVYNTLKQYIPNLQANELIQKSNQPGIFNRAMQADKSMDVTARNATALHVAKNGLSPELRNMEIDIGGKMYPAFDVITAYLNPKSVDMFNPQVVDNKNAVANLMGYSDLDSMLTEVGGKGRSALKKFKELGYNEASEKLASTVSDEGGPLNRVAKFLNDNTMEHGLNKDHTSIFAAHNKMQSNMADQIMSKVTDTVNNMSFQNEDGSLNRTKLLFTPVINTAHGKKVSLGDLAIALNQSKGQEFYDVVQRIFGIDYPTIDKILKGNQRVNVKLDGNDYNISPNIKQLAGIHTKNVLNSLVLGPGNIKTIELNKQLGTSMTIYPDRTIKLPDGTIKPIHQLFERDGNVKAFKTPYENNQFIYAVQKAIKTSGNKQGLVFDNSQESIKMRNKEYINSIADAFSNGTEDASLMTTAIAYHPTSPDGTTLLNNGTNEPSSIWAQSNGPQMRNDLIKNYMSQGIDKKTAEYLSKKKLTAGYVDLLNLTGLPLKVDKGTSLVDFTLQKQTDMLYPNNNDLGTTERFDNPFYSSVQSLKNEPTRKLFEMRKGDIADYVMKVDKRAGRLMRQGLAGKALSSLSNEQYHGIIKDILKPAIESNIVKVSSKQKWNEAHTKEVLDNLESVLESNNIDNAEKSWQDSFGSKIGSTLFRANYIAGLFKDLANANKTYNNRSTQFALFNTRTPEGIIDRVSVYKNFYDASHEYIKFFTNTGDVSNEHPGLVKDILEKTSGNVLAATYMSKALVEIVKPLDFYNNIKDSMKSQITQFHLDKNLTGHLQDFKPEELTNIFKDDDLSNILSNTNFSSITGIETIKQALCNYGGVSGDLNNTELIAKQIAKSWKETKLNPIDYYHEDIETGGEYKTAIPKHLVESVPPEVLADYNAWSLSQGYQEKVGELHKELDLKSNQIEKAVNSFLKYKTFYNAIGDQALNLAKSFDDFIIKQKFDVNDPSSFGPLGLATRAVNNLTELSNDLKSMDSKRFLSSISTTEAGDLAFASELNTKLIQPTLKEEGILQETREELNTKFDYKNQSGVPMMRMMLNAIEATGHGPINDIGTRKFFTDMLREQSNEMYNRNLFGQKPNIPIDISQTALPIDDIIGSAIEYHNLNNQDKMWYDQMQKLGVPEFQDAWSNLDHISKRDLSEVARQVISSKVSGAINKAKGDMVIQEFWDDNGLSFDPARPKKLEDGSYGYIGIDVNGIKKNIDLIDLYNLLDKSDRSYKTIYDPSRLSGKVNSQVQVALLNMQEVARQSYGRYGDDNPYAAGLITEKLSQGINGKYRFMHDHDVSMWASQLDDKDSSQPFDAGSPMSIIANVNGESRQLVGYGITIMNRSVDVKNSDKMKAINKLEASGYHADLAPDQKAMMTNGRKIPSLIMVDSFGGKDPVIYSIPLSSVQNATSGDCYGWTSNRQLERLKKASNGIVDGIVSSLKNPRIVENDFKAYPDAKYVMDREGFYQDYNYKADNTKGNLQVRQKLLTLAGGLPNSEFRQYAVAMSKDAIGTDLIKLMADGYNSYQGKMKYWGGSYVVTTAAAGLIATGAALTGNIPLAGLMAGTALKSVTGFTKNILWRKVIANRATTGQWALRNYIPDLDKNKDLTISDSFASYIWRPLTEVYKSLGEVKSLSESDLSMAAGKIARLTFGEHLTTEGSNYGLDIQTKDVSLQKKIYKERLDILEKTNKMIENAGRTDLDVTKAQYLLEDLLSSSKFNKDVKGLVYKDQSGSFSTIAGLTKEDITVAKDELGSWLSSTAYAQFLANQEKNSAMNTTKVGLKHSINMQEQLKKAFGNREIFQDGAVNQTAWDDVLTMNTLSYISQRTIGNFEKIGSAATPFGRWALMFSQFLHENIYDTTIGSANRRKLYRALENEINLLPKDDVARKVMTKYGILVGDKLFHTPKTETKAILGSLTGNMLLSLVGLATLQTMNNNLGKDVTEITDDALKMIAEPMNLSGPVQNNLVRGVVGLGFDLFANKPTSQSIVSNASYGQQDLQSTLGLGVGQSQVLKPEVVIGYVALRHILEEARIVHKVTDHKQMEALLDNTMIEMTNELGLGNITRTLLKKKKK